jgi:hypothetical protein
MFYIKHFVDMVRFHQLRSSASGGVAGSVAIGKLLSFTMDLFRMAFRPSKVIYSSQLSCI